MWLQYESLAFLAFFSGGFCKKGGNGISGLLIDDGRGDMKTGERARRVYSTWRRIGVPVRVLAAAGEVEAAVFEDIGRGAVEGWWQSSGMAMAGLSPKHR